jgi:hypothetical protein
MIPHIPIIPKNSIFGYTKFIFHNGNCHQEYLNVAKEFGPISQYNLFGIHGVLIHDKVLAREVLKAVKTKMQSQDAKGISPVNFV